MAETYKDAIALLKADHRKVEDLFSQFEGAKSPSKKESLAKQICTELKIHTAIEEEIFYPACNGKVEKDDMDEAYVEHDGAKLLINDIEASAPDAEYYDAKVMVLSEEIKHHVKEEEARGEGMFAQAKKEGVDVDGLLDQMLARKKELMAQAKTSGLPPAKTTTLVTA